MIQLQVTGKIVKKLRNHWVIQETLWVTYRMSIHGEQHVLKDASLVEAHGSISTRELEEALKEPTKFYVENEMKVTLL